MADFKKLHVWRKAHALALNTDHVAAKIRPRRHSSLRNQMSRAAMSIGANIVEGRGKASEAEFARYLRSSVNSASELEYHLLVAHDLKAMSTKHYAKLTAQTIEVRKMLYGLLDRINDRKAEKDKGDDKSRPQDESSS
ncbi:MAG TPA: four helix bundle protein [Gemmatimonadaceae bacterium]|nr:four helix bundle protein [Gemmatimonadaceae bacterium]